MTLDDAVSSVITANVSSDSNNNNNNQSEQQQLFASPPRIQQQQQPNYSNIQQPEPVLPLQPQQQQQFQRPSPLSSVQTLGIPSSSTASTGGGAFSRSAVRPRTPNSNEEAEAADRRRQQQPLVHHAAAASISSSAANGLRMADVHDLIHLKQPATEDDVLRTLQARFVNQKYFVSSNSALEKDLKKC